MLVKLKNNFILFLFTALISGFIGVFIWSFLKVLSGGTTFLWEWLPKQFSFPGYPVVVCLVGGILLGLFQKKYGKWPQELEMVMGTIKKEGTYPYHHVFMMAVAAMLPLLFGGSIGPEAGLTGVIAALCFWAGDNFQYAGLHVKEMTKTGICATLGAIFHAPLFGFFLPLEEQITVSSPVSGTAPKKNNTYAPTAAKETLSKPQKIVIYLIAALCGFGTFTTLSRHFGGGLGLPKLSGAPVSGKDWVWILVFLLTGILCGILFQGSQFLIARLYQPFSSGNKILIATISGALFLGIAGTFFPLVLFSGEEQMEILAEEYLSYAPLLLIGIGILKLLLTNICIQSGWRGGHFFPVIFAGVSIGYGAAMMTGTQPVYAVSMITASLLGFTMKRPIAVVLLLMLCFPAHYIIGITAAAFVAAFIGKTKPFSFLEKKCEEAKES